MKTTQSNVTIALILDNARVILASEERLMVDCSQIPATNRYLILSYSSGSKSGLIFSPVTASAESHYVVGARTDGERDLGVLQEPDSPTPPLRF